MLTWQLDRLVRSATGCFLAGLGIAIAAAAAVAGIVDSTETLGAALVSVITMAGGAATGAMPVVGAGVALFGLSVALAEPGIGWLVLIGSALFFCLQLFDLSISLRRGPLVERGVWIGIVLGTLVVAVGGVGLTIVVWAIGGARTWPVIVVPIALAAVGFGVRTMAELHHRRVRALQPDLSDDTADPH